jgi:hypothetical protein
MYKVEATDTSNQILLLEILDTNGKLHVLGIRNWQTACGSLLLHFL